MHGLPMPSGAPLFSEETLARLEFWGYQFFWYDEPPGNHSRTAWVKYFSPSYGKETLSKMVFFQTAKNSELEFSIDSGQFESQRKEIEWLPSPDLLAERLADRLLLTDLGFIDNDGSQYRASLRAVLMAMIASRSVNLIEDLRINTQDSFVSLEIEWRDKLSKATVELSLAGQFGFEIYIPETKRKILVAEETVLERAIVLREFFAKIVRYRRMFRHKISGR